MRPSKEETYLKIAHLMGKLSTCDRALVGCVIVKDGRIISTGYNGSVSGHDHCDDVGHLMNKGHCARTIHAEQNALLQCAKHGISCNGAIMYVTHTPCHICTKLMLQAGISEVVYSESYREEENMFLKYLKYKRITIGGIGLSQD